MIRNPNIPKECIKCKYCPKEKHNIRKDYLGWCEIIGKGIYKDTKACIKGEY